MSGCNESWYLKLKRGQKEWIVLSHNWKSSIASPDCSAPIQLRRGAYDIELVFSKPAPQFDLAGTIHPANTGFEVKYEGPDTNGSIQCIQDSNLFPISRDFELKPDDLEGTAADFLDGWYVNSIRDIRRTYQRAFKACLFLSANELSPLPVADDGTSEVEYLLGNPEEFEGYSYYINGTWSTHHAQLFLDLFPLLDNFHKPTPGKDKRVKPSLKRQQALFDWWERIFDYTRLRLETNAARERPIWLLFHEAKENQNLCKYLTIICYVLFSG